MANLGSFVKGIAKPTGFNIGKGRDISGVRWVGLDKVLKNINKEVDKIEGRTVAGMLQAGQLVRREAQKITPVDTGNLKASAYVIWGGRGKKVNTKSTTKFKMGEGKSGGRVASEHGSKVGNRVESNQGIQRPFAEIGFTAFYAAFVHENLTASHVKRGKVKLFGKRKTVSVQAGQAKFLEQALMQNTRRIFEIIKARARVK